MIEELIGLSFFFYLESIWGIVILKYFNRKWMFCGVNGGGGGNILEWILYFFRILIIFFGNFQFVGRFLLFFGLFKFDCV